MTIQQSPSTTAALKELADVSAPMGRDFSLIQAAGGNTSIKDGNTLWVKASGQWLMHAQRQPLFVPVRLHGVRARIAADEADPVGPELQTELDASGLRPSIETTLHALMPQRAVLHAHSIDAIAWTVREDGQESVTERLIGLRWGWVPYVRPGLPLTRRVALALADAARTQNAVSGNEDVSGGAALDVLVFGNHGLLTGAATPAAALDLMHRVVERLVMPARVAPLADTASLESAARGTPYRLPTEAACHALGTDAVSTRIAAGGALYPDHVVFLGGGLMVIDPARGDVDGQLRALPVQPAVILAGAGVLVHQSLGAAGEAMLQCLSEVAQRIDPAATLRYLPQEEVTGLQQWDAEKYRQQLAH